MTREELINSKEYKVVNAAFDWMEEHQDADLLDAFEAGEEWGNKQVVEKALKFLLDYDPNDYLEEIADFGVYKLNEEKVKTAFYKAMEQ